MSQKCILVVDDDESIRSMVVEALADEGYPVVGVGDGQEALVKIEQELPSVVFLDLRMARLDGWSFVEEIRRRDVTVPIVVMTAATTEDARQWSEELGVSDYLVKPFDLTQLFAMAERFCVG